MYFLRKTIITKYTNYSNRNNVLLLDEDDYYEYEFIKINSQSTDICFDNMTFNELIEQKASLLWQYEDIYYPIDIPVNEVLKHEFIEVCKLNNTHYITLNECNPNPFSLKNTCNSTVSYDLSNNKIEILIGLYDDKHNFIKYSIFDKTAQTYFIEINTQNIYSSPFNLFANCE